MSTPTIPAQLAAARKENAQLTACVSELERELIIAKASAITAQKKATPAQPVAAPKSAANTLTGFARVQAAFKVEESR